MPHLQMEKFKMPIILPENRQEILENLQTDFVANIPESDPFIRESWLLALLIAIAYREFDIYTQINEMILQLFPDTAEGVFAEQWGSLKGVSRNPATGATGFITATGTLGSEIAETTLWSTTDGKQYAAVNQNYTITANENTISNLISSGGIADATTVNDHHLASGLDVTISGANETEYNGTFEITVTGTNTFKYSISGSPASPATGTIVADINSASVFVEAQDTGKETNVGSGGILTLVNPIAGVDANAIVQYTELGGGSDEETDEAFRERYLERYQNQVANFNTANIVNTAKEVPGVTRVFVFEITPEAGDVTIYFMRDNDDDPIPNGQEVTDVKNKLLTITPAHTPTTGGAGLIVLAPTPVVVDFTFTNLSPNTSTMHSAITASLEQFFKDYTEVNKDILQVLYSSAILNTVDQATGEFVESFTLSTPAGDIAIGTNEIGVLGTVTFSL